MSLERRFGFGVLALGVGETALAAATLLGPHSAPLTGVSMVVLALGSFALGALLISGRMPLDVTDTHRLVRIIANASLVGGIGGTFVGGALLIESVL